MYTRVTFMPRTSETSASAPAAKPATALPSRVKPVKAKRAATRSTGPKKPGWTDGWPRWARITLQVAKWAALSMLAMLAVGVATLALLFYVWDDDTPIKSKADYVKTAKLTTRVISADGELLGEIYEERRTLVEYQDIPPHVVNAFLAAEDADFFKHGGLDYLGMARALWKDVLSGKKKQGASTITQQVAKTFYLTRERSLKRKIKEIQLARRLERALSKQDILFLYLNQIYFGHGRYGVEEASQFYFGKSVRNLDVGEAAMLASLPKAPNEYSPIRNPVGAKARQRWVLGQMAAKGFVTPAVADEFKGKQLQVVDPTLGAPYQGSAPEVVDAVREQLARKFGADTLPTLGLNVRVTIDARLQKAAREAVEKGLREIDQRHGYAAAIEKLSGAKRERRLKEFARAHGGKLGNNKPYQAVITAVDDAAGLLKVDLGGIAGMVEAGGKSSRYNPDDKPASARFAVNDVIWVRKLPELPAAARAEADGPTKGGAGAGAGADAKGKSESVGAGAGAVKVASGPRLVLDLGPQAALVSIDPMTRKVLAIVGGYGFRAGDFNRALDARRQPGSSFKAFVYGAALAAGTYTPATIVNDAPEVYALWKPQNSQKDFKGPVRMRAALAGSINTVAIRLTSDVGTEAIAGFARAAGIESKLTRDLSLALGASEVTPLELVNAYATIAAGGYAGEPQFIEELSGTPVPAIKLHPAIAPDVAYVLTSMLESVIKDGTGKRALALRRPVAGKTGTSNDQKDAWFVGFTPELVTGVWVGFDELRTLGSGEAGGKTAAPIWVDFMTVALKGKPPRQFKAPQGVVTVKIDAKTGLLAPPGAPGFDEVFLDGTQPTELAPAAGEVAPDSFLVDQAAED